MTPQRILHFAAACFLLPAALSAQTSLQLALKVGRPVAIDGSSTSGYYVLARGSVVFHYIPENGALKFQNRFENIELGDSSDLTTASIGGQESVILASFSTNTHYGYISRYSPDGKLIKSWPIRKFPQGVNFDPASGNVYFSTSDSNEIYRLHIDGGQPEFVCEIDGAQHLGALVVDPSGRSLYVADDNKGVIYRVDLKTSHSTLAAQNLRQPSALRFSGNQKTIYIADALAHRVFSIPAGQSSTAKTTEVVSKGLSAPSGIALGFNNALLISDFQSDSVYQVAP
jgi:sugar lactone lactonase YvrE